MGSLAETQKLVRQKEEEIEKLRKDLRDRDARISYLEDEVQTLRSQLDKYQSVMAGGHRPSPVSVAPRKVRAQGISAEPQPQATVGDRIRKHSKAQV